MCGRGPGPWRAAYGKGSGRRALQGPRRPRPPANRCPPVVAGKDWGGARGELKGLRPGGDPLTSDPSQTQVGPARGGRAGRGGVRSLEGHREGLDLPTCGDRGSGAGRLPRPPTPGRAPAPPGSVPGGGRLGGGRPGREGRRRDLLPPRPGTPVRLGGRGRRVDLRRLAFHGTRPRRPPPRRTLEQGSSREREGATGPLAPGTLLPEAGPAPGAREVRLSRRPDPPPAWRSRGGARRRSPGPGRPSPRPEDSRLSLGEGKRRVEGPWTGRPAPRSLEVESAGSGVPPAGVPWISPYPTLKEVRSSLHTALIPALHW